MLYYYNNEIVIYGPNLHEDVFYNSKVIKDLDESKIPSERIVVNRKIPKLLDVKEKVYTRDIFGKD